MDAVLSHVSGVVNYVKTHSPHLLRRRYGRCPSFDLRLEERLKVQPPADVGLTPAEAHAKAQKELDDELRHDHDRPQPIPNTTRRMTYITAV